MIFFDDASQILTKTPTQHFEDGFDAAVVTPVLMR